MSLNGESSPDTAALLQEILSSLKALRQDQNQLATAVDTINGRVNALAGVKQAQDGFTHDASYPSPRLGPSGSKAIPQGHRSRGSLSSTDGYGKDINGPTKSSSSSPPPRRGSTTSKIILTSYPGQAGVDPLPMEWGASDPKKRGPVVVSRNSSSIRRRNAIGAHGGSYSIYYALAVASHQLDTDHKPDYTNTEPAANIGPFRAWSDPKKIVSMDPYGHLAPWLFKDIIRDDNVEIRPTIAVTRAHMKIPELEESVRNGRLVREVSKQESRCFVSHADSLIECRWKGMSQRVRRAQRDKICCGTGMVSTWCGRALWH